MSPNTPARSEYRLSVTMALVLLPWIAVVLFTAGVWAALNLFAYAIVVFVAGYGIARIALPASVRSQIIVLAPAVGILAISALTAFWVRLRHPLIYVSVLWLVLVAIGALYLWSDRAIWSKSTVAYGGALVLLSAMICGVYLLPSARNDAVSRRDGSFNWLYVDTQYNYSIAAAIKRASPPKEPGTYTEELLYHFGGYAPAAAISRIDRLDLGDAYARVTRGASLWALMLSCLGLGTLLSLKATGEKFGGIMSVAGLFFYGSLLAMFTDERNSSSYVTGAILFRIPEAMVGHDGGPFSHLLLGHSELHGLLAITAIMGLCLAQREWGTVTWREIILLALPALAVPMHSVAALYCIGVVAILLFWGRLVAVRSWLLIILMLCLFLAAWKIMGYSHAPDATRVMIKPELGLQWWTVAGAFMIGLGLRIVGFRWISKPLSDPVSALVLATVVSLMLFFLLVHFKGGEEIYGVYFLQSMFSIFAFSRLTHGWWRSVERSQWTQDWLRLAAKGTFLLATCGVLIGIVAHARHGFAGIEYFRDKIFLSFLLFAILVGASMLMKRSRQFSTVASAMIMCVLLIGFLAWIPPWLNFGLGRMKMDVTLTPGEVQGLNRLDQLAAPGDQIATNKHEVDSLASHRQRSYAYAALAEHPVLLEGLQYHTPAELPWFQNLVRDNDSIFSTTDPAVLRNITNAWGVRWLVARPGTDISLPRPLPPWLVEQPDSGTLKIYRID
jgi:hypothetical protein